MINKLVVSNYNEVGSVQILTSLIGLGYVIIEKKTNHLWIFLSVNFMMLML